MQLALFGYFSLIALMACAAAFFFAVRPSVELTLLEHEISDVLPVDHKEWLNKDPDDRLFKITKIRENPNFAKLHADTQQKVKSAEDEINLYVTQNKVFVESKVDPKFAKNEDDLTEIEDNLKGVKIPGKYEEDWKETRLVRKRQVFLDELVSLRESLKEMEAWLKVQVKDSKDLQKKGFSLSQGDGTAAERKKWVKDVDTLFNRKFKDKGPLEMIPKSTTITYSSLTRFQSEELNRLRQQLRDNKKFLGSLKEQVEKMEVTN